MRGKHLIIAIIALSVALPAQAAWYDRIYGYFNPQTQEGQILGAVTSTRVQNLFINDLKSSGFILAINSAGLVVTSTDQTGSGGPNGVQVPAPDTLANYFAAWRQSGSSTLLATTSLLFSGTSLLWNGPFNASGTITQNGTAVLTTSTGLTTANFASANISQWTNDAGYKTSTVASALVRADAGQGFAAYAGDNKACGGSDQVTSVQISPTGTVVLTCSAQGSGSGGGNVITTAASTLAGRIPYWTANASTTLNPTSTIYINPVNGFVGINTTTPNVYQLHVAGDVGAEGTTPYIDLYETDQNTTAGMYQQTKVLRLYSDAAGSIRFDNDVDFQGITIKSTLIPTLADTYDLGSLAKPWAGLFLGPDECISFGSANNGKCLVSDEVGNDAYNLLLMPPSELFTATSGRVGIGVEQFPSSTLHVSGTAIVSGRTTSTDLTVTGITNALHLGGASGAVSAYAGTTYACGGSDQMTSVTLSATGTVSATCSAQGSGSGSGNVIVTAANTLATQVPYWLTSASSTLAPTSTLTLLSTGANVTGTIWQSGAAVLTTSTGLTTANFVSANVSQWTNDSAYVTSTGANPTASVGLTAVNGTSNTFLRSDGAPALSQSIAPTWTGAHIWNGATTFNNTSTHNSSTVFGSFLQLNEITTPGTTTNALRIYAVDQDGYTVLEGIGDKGLARRFARDNYFVAKVQEAGGITKGQAVYISGGAGGNEQVKLARANASSTMPFVGVALDTGANNEFIRVLFAGKIDDIDTSGYTVGTTLWVDAATAGNLTSTIPAHPNLKQRVAVVTRSQSNNGELLVLPQGVRGDHEGTNVDTWVIGDATSTVTSTKSITFSNGFLGVLGAAQTAARTWTLPDVSGSIFVQSAAQTCSGNDKVSSISPTGTITCSTDQTGGSGSGNVNVTAASTLVGQVPYWNTAASSTLNPTSSLTILANGNVNASGTITSNGTAVLTTSTGLTTANFASANVSQWTNDSNYLTTSTGLTTANFASANISQWTNNANYVTSTGANPTASVGTSAVNGSANTFMRSDGAPAINQAATFSFSALGNTTSTANISAATMRINGNAVSTSTGANPTASVGTSAVNGSANTFMRSDGAPAIDQAAAFSFSALGNTTSTANISALTMRINGVAPLTTSTGLTTANFASANISQWANNSGFTTYASSGPWSASQFLITNKLNVSSTFTGAVSSSILGLSVGTTTLPGLVFEAHSAGTSTIKFGDASSTKPACFMFSQYPTGTSWAYAYIQNFAWVVTSTPCN